MTRIDPALLIGLTRALGATATPVFAPAAQRRRDGTDGVSGNRTRGRHATAAGVLALIRARVERAGKVAAPSHDELLRIAIQETLVMEFGEEIATHPRFGDVVDRIQSTLAAIPDFRRILPLLSPPGTANGPSRGELT